MKSIKIIVSLIVFSSFFPSCGNSAGIALTGPGRDTLVPFQLQINTNGCFSSTDKMEITYSKGRYYAISYNLAEKYRLFPDINMAVELDSAKIRLCLNFLKTARSMPKKCGDNSVRYTFILTNGLILREGGCDWGENSFYNLNKILFKELNEQLEIRVKKEIQEFRHKLKGKWVYKETRKKLKIGDTVLITRTEKPGKNCYWELGPDSLFSSKCNKYWDFTHSSRYDIRLGKVPEFHIESGFVLHKDRSMTIENDGAYFDLLFINPDEIKLVFSGY